jgi:iron complex outermembrane receptor protein
MSRPFLRHTACLFIVAAGLAGAAEPVRPATAAEVVELSPFEVNTSRDVGYVAENTLAGSRLNARLRDTAGSVAVLTKEFLDDLAITDLQGLLEYTVNSELDTNAWQAGATGRTR